MQDQIKEQAIYAALLATAKDETRSQTVFEELQWIKLEEQDEKQEEAQNSRSSLFARVQQYLKDYASTPETFKELEEFEAFLRSGKKPPAKKSDDLYFPIGALKIEESFPYLYRDIQGAWDSPIDAEHVQKGKYNTPQLMTLAGLIIAVEQSAAGRAISEGTHLVSRRGSLDLKAMKANKVNRLDIQTVLNGLIKPGIPLFEGETTQFSEAFIHALKAGPPKKLRADTQAVPKEPAALLEATPQKKPRFMLAVTLSLLALTFLASLFSIVPAVPAFISGVGISLCTAIFYISSEGRDRLALVWGAAAAINLLLLVVSISVPSFAAFVAFPSNLSFMTDFFAGLSPLFLAGIALGIGSVLNLLSMASIWRNKPEKREDKMGVYLLHTLQMMVAAAAIVITSLLFAAAPLPSPLQVLAMIPTLLLSVASMGGIATKMYLWWQGKKVREKEALFPSPLSAASLPDYPPSAQALVQQQPAPLPTSRPAWLDPVAEREEKKDGEDAPFFVGGGEFPQVASEDVKTQLEYNAEEKSLYGRPHLRPDMGVRDFWESCVNRGGLYFNGAKECCITEEHKQKIEALIEKFEQNAEYKEIKQLIEALTLPEKLEKLKAEIPDLEAKLGKRRMLQGQLDRKRIEVVQLQGQIAAWIQKEGSIAQAQEKMKGEIQALQENPAYQLAYNNVINAYIDMFFGLGKDASLSEPEKAAQRNALVPPDKRKHIKNFIAGYNQATTYLLDGGVFSRLLEDKKCEKVIDSLKEDPERLALLMPSPSRPPGYTFKEGMDNAIDLHVDLTETEISAKFVRHDRTRSVLSSIFAVDSDLAGAIPQGDNSVMRRETEVELVDGRIKIQSVRYEGSNVFNRLINALWTGQSKEEISAIFHDSLPKKDPKYHGSSRSSCAI